MKKHKWLTIGLLVLIIAVVATSSVALSSVTSTRTTVRVPALPLDVDRICNITNTEQGLCVGYIDKKGNPKMVQYSGGNYKSVYIFKFKSK